MQTLIMFGISILLFLLMLLLFRNKIKVHSILTYVVLLLTPFVMAVVPFAAVYFSIAQISQNHYLILLFIWLACLELAIFCITYLVKMNIIRLKGKENRREISLRESKKLLHYSIVVNILYVLPMLAAIIWLILSMAKGGIQYIQFLIEEAMSPLEALTGTFFAIALCLILYLFLLMADWFSLTIAAIAVHLIFTATVFFISALAPVIAMSLNSTIRAVKELPELKKQYAKYIILILIPYVNVVVMFYLCHVIRKSLKNKGDSVYELQHEN